MQEGEVKMPTKQIKARIWCELSKTEVIKWLKARIDLSIEEINNQKFNFLEYKRSGLDYLIHIAAWIGDYRAVELLLEAGMDINALGDMDYTPLHYAKENGHENIAQLLLSHGASTKLRNAFGQLPLDILEKRGQIPS